MPVDPEQFALMKKRHEEIPKRVAEAMQPTLERAAADIVAEMKREAPILRGTSDERQPGELRDSIKATPSENRVTISAGNKDVPYAAHVEYGTSKMAAEPFFWPAIRLLRARTTATIRQAFNEAVSDAWGSP